MEANSKATSSSFRSESAAACKASGHLIFFSVLLLVFGVGRTNLFSFYPTGSMGGSSTIFPPAVLLACGVCLCVIGLLGLAVGTLHLSLNVSHATLTLVSLALEGALGWFVFVSQAIAFHAYEADKLAVSTFDKGLWMLQMFGGASMGVALLGSQFYFSLQLYRMQSLEDGAAVYDSKYLRKRIVFYSLLVVIKAGCEVAMGVLVYKNDPPLNPVQSPYMSFKYRLIIADGCITLLVGLYGMVIGIAGLSKQGLYFALVAFSSLIIQLGMYDLAQLSQSIPLRSYQLGVLGVILVPLTVGLMCMPIFLVAAMDREKEGEEAPVHHTQGIVFSQSP